ncbi:endonuclease V [Halococcus saccharolyticus]|uniref:Endonuclease V n=1 Tax=Halococcus saccharolyticus DSM 5350 TaxID=1227455 RepID=M0MGQ6_9EURY|nr:endonuclease V [Halococcus saccharolyticus]EMA44917.1 endonuclease V [Halococcus saccharolyticus DSM 5350]
MEPARPAFVPDPSASRETMETLQREIAATATFSDDFGFDPAAVSTADTHTLDAITDDRTATSPSHDDQPIVVGVDQAFLDDRAVGAIVAFRGGEVIERAHAVVDLEFPYVPGLLSFREAGAILAAFERLDVEPDLAVFDGSGRIHYREAGLATHMGVTLDLPAVGVAKGLLCGAPQRSLDDLSEGTRVAITADDSVETADDTDTVIGYALQTRQYDSGNRYINPVYVSAGHRVGSETAADLVERLCNGYKLPEPTRLADSYADEVKRDHDD